MANQVICTICNGQVDKLLYRFHIESERYVIEQLKLHHPDWSANDGICSRCVDHFQSEVLIQHRMLPEVGPYFPVKSPDDYIILPTPLRLDADPRFTGKGITICFIDSGFYPHPDLVTVKNRIKAYVDITRSPQNVVLTKEAEDACWHGTMTSVVCAGNGYLSSGLYKGIASDAELVLLKVQNAERKITRENIEKALLWVLENYVKYQIRIINMSLGDDEVISYHTSTIDRLAEALVEKGITIIAAAGNDEQAGSKPPANAPNVITVGGINDHNNLAQENITNYHSTYGATIDGFMKPELVAQAIWIAAPILPATGAFEESFILHQLSQTNNEDLIFAINSADEIVQKKLQLEIDFHKQNDVTFLRERIAERIQETKFFTAGYIHADGTSFAAPIVSSIVAQMLEANSLLTPYQIRSALFGTATRLSSLPAERQGFGYVRARKTIFHILKKESIMKPHPSPYFNKRKKTIEFFMHNDCASQVSLVGSFNHWAQDVLLMEPGKNGNWKIEIPMLPEGKYHYKFFVDDKMWMEDVDNPYREPDGLTGFNSVLMIER
jgi:serine protease AprX